VPYRVEFSKPAVRQFEKLSKPVQTRLRPRIDALAHDPRPQGVKKLVGADELYRLRVGDYRVRFTEEHPETLCIHAVKNRKGNYR